LRPTADNGGGACGFPEAPDNAEIFFAGLNAPDGAVSLAGELGREGRGVLPSNQDILEFIRSSIRSVWALEMLLVLRRHGERAWTVEQLVAELRASTPLVADNLAVFEAAGLVLMEDGRYRYAPASPWLESLCTDLEAAYRERPVTVINAIVSPPGDKLRTLANAFRLKGDT
jgi:hypothetical protein